SPGVVLVHDQRNPEHPDFEFSRELKELFAAETTADGVPFDVVPIPAPEVLRDDEGFVDYSYVNHLVTNGGVLACTFDAPMAAEAAAVLERVYPGRKVVGVDARELYARGGGIHCITSSSRAWAERMPQVSRPATGRRLRPAGPAGRDRTRRAPIVPVGPRHGISWCGRTQCPCADPTRCPELWHATRVTVTASCAEEQGNEEESDSTGRS